MPHTASPTANPSARDPTVSTIPENVFPRIVRRGRRTWRGRTVGQVKIDVLSVPDCPNHPIAVARIVQATVAAGVTDAEIVERVITNNTNAEALGMHGSPTILIDGCDPFDNAGTRPSMSCRLYRTAAGLEGSPSVAELIAEVTRAQ